MRGGWRRLGRLLLLLLLRGCIVASALPAGKDPPEKGGTHCPSLEERYQDFRNGGDGSAWLQPCDDEAEYEERPPHGIRLELFAALPAYAGNFRT